MANDLVTYESNGEEVKISPTMIKKYLVNGGGSPSDQEVMMFLSLCKFQHLNPFLREAHLIKYGSKSPATMVVGKDVFTKRANTNPNYQGKQAGIIVVNKNGEIIEREGTMKLPSEEIVGGWAKVFIKGHVEPEYASVSMEEYIGKKADGTVNNQWKTKPATMIRKVAVVQALREAFPDKFQGMYAQEEMPEVSGAPLDDKQVPAEEIIEQHENSVDFQEVVEVQEQEVEVVDADEEVGTVEDIPDFMKG